MLHSWRLIGGVTSNRYLTPDKSSLIDSDLKMIIVKYR